MSTIDANLEADKGMLVVIDDALGVGWRGMAWGGVVWLGVAWRGMRFGLV